MLKKGSDLVRTDQYKVGSQVEWAGKALLSQNRGDHDHQNIMMKRKEG